MHKENGQWNYELRDKKHPVHGSCFEAPIGKRE